MRGKAVQSPTRLPSGWITPAHAGKSWQNTFRCAVHQDHPRACGEKPTSQYSAKTYSGSPPRMRGKGINAACWFARLRITPAHAGKSSLQRACRRGLEDHPRACGEKSTALQMAASVPGSPPRMRGKEEEREIRILNGGITPAHAGKSDAADAYKTVGMDHPRACGEKSTICLPSSFAI